MDFVFKIAQTKEDFEKGKILFKEYADTLHLNLEFQHFSTELETISIQYKKPKGVLILIFYQEKPIGCIGLRKWNQNIGEIKRMYVNPHFRKQGLGFRLLQKAVSAAIELGYSKVRLDTLAYMDTAIELYHKFHFYSIKPYYQNPIKGALFFEKDLINS